MIPTVHPRTCTGGRLAGTVVLACAVSSAPTTAQVEVTADTLRDAHVQAAIVALVEELYRRRDPDSFWEPTPYPGQVPQTQAGGYTALVTLALLHAGETYQDERLAAAVEYLEATELGGTYAVGLRANVWAMLPPKFEAALDRDRRWLLETFSREAAGWNYTADPYTRRKDNSIKQYGTLGLWEAAKRGQMVPAPVWQTLERSMFELQLADGGWDYNGTSTSTGSMTTAGLTILFITQDFLHAADAVNIGRNERNPNQAAIDRGLQWMNANFTAETNPGRDTDYYYYLYGVERVGLASGYRHFGGRDWYREGAIELIRRLCHWDPDTRTMRAHERVGGNPRAGTVSTEDLAFSLMFLSRGRVPIAINKLNDPNLAWNNRPRDIANLTRWIQTNAESGVNWQVVGIEAESADWLDAPILYLASYESPSWAPRDGAEAQSLIASRLEARESRLRDEHGDFTLAHLEVPELRKLREYLDLGGMLVANAESGGTAFSEAIERLGQVLYPHLTWRTLPADHPVYTVYQAANAEQMPLRGLSNGVRELIVLSRHTDLSRHYQAPDEASEEALGLGMNLFLYASEMNRARPRLDTHVLTRSAEHAASTSFTIARIVHPGAWDAEPRALDVFAAWAWNEHGADVRVVDIAMSDIASVSPRPDLVHLAGIDKAVLSDADLDVIERCAEQGILVLIETVGGRGDFAASIEAALRERGGGAPKSMLRHPVVSGDGAPGSVAAARVEYRPASFDVFGAREMTTRLRGVIGDDGRATILFSREDLSNGLLDQPTYGVCGYTAPWARSLYMNIIRYGAAGR
jgi:hypothetical protein